MKTQKIESIQDIHIKAAKAADAGKLTAPLLESLLSRLAVPYKFRVEEHLKLRNSNNGGRL